MQRLDIKFLVLAAACLMVGVSLGIYMGVRHDFAMAPVHAHLNLLGWASLALFGITYRLYPELQERALAKVHFALAAPAAVAFPFGIYLAIFHEQPLLGIVAAFAWAAGVLLFLVQLIGLARQADRRAKPAAAAA